MADKLQKIQDLQRLKLLRVQQTLANITAEENTLRRDLGTLNAHRKESHAADPSLLTMRSIGADILWQGWIDRTQADLTTELAKVLARKEPIQRRVARETSRDTVATELQARATRARQQRNDQKRQEAVMSMAAVLSALNRDANQK